MKMFNLLSFVKNKLGFSSLQQQIQGLVKGYKYLKQENKQLRQELKQHRSFVQKKVAELKEYIRVDADIGYRGESTIILIGVYKNRAYIRFYDMSNRDFEAVVRQMKDMKDHALIRNVDPPSSFEGSFELQELKR